MQITFSNISVFQMPLTHDSLLSSRMGWEGELRVQSRSEITKQANVSIQTINISYHCFKWNGDLLLTLFFFNWDQEKKILFVIQNCGNIHCIKHIGCVWEQILNHRYANYILAQWSAQTSQNNIWFHSCFYTTQLDHWKTNNYCIFTQYIKLGKCHLLWLCIVWESRVFSWFKVQGVPWR